MKKFVLIGVGGYIAPQHLRAIKDTGNILVAALDKNDSVGIIDSYFPDASFFTEFERFDRYVEKQKREKGMKIDYVSICSPNYLHDAHIRFALRVGADVICEKPIVLNPWNIDALSDIEKETGGKINSILQLRYHPSIIELKDKIDLTNSRKYNIKINYIATRGRWYDISWKGDIQKSGGVATNIGIHFFDMVTWIFGKTITNTVTMHEDRRASGILELEHAHVEWFLSVDKDDLPNKNGLKTFRSITIDGYEVDFSDGFANLHTVSYQKILDGDGFRIEDTRESIDIVSKIRGKYGR